MVFFPLQKEGAFKIVDQLNFLKRVHYIKTSFYYTQIVYDLFQF